MYTGSMTKFEIVKPTRKQVRWAVGREFVHLPPVDPAFGSLKGLRRLFLQHMILPVNYMQQMLGFILLIDGQPAGYAFARSRTIASRIDSLAVEPEHRRNGYAAKLVARVAALAKEYEHDYLVASMTPENAPAAAFFVKQGFQPYRAQGFILEDVDRLESYQQPEVALQELGPNNLTAAYEQWMGYELKHGNPWAEEIVQGEYARTALYTRARHWLCMHAGEAVGYLRVAGLRGRMTAYLACDQAWWADAVQLRWLAQALKQYPTSPNQVLFDMASDGHTQAAEAIMHAAGLTDFGRPRYLLFKKLK